MCNKVQSVWVALVGHDDIVSFAQSDLDAVGAYVGGVRVDILERHCGQAFNRYLKICCDKGVIV